MEILLPPCLFSCPVSTFSKAFCFEIGNKRNVRVGAITIAATIPNPWPHKSVQSTTCSQISHEGCDGAWEHHRKSYLKKDTYKIQLEVMASKNYTISIHSYYCRSSQRRDAVPKSPNPVSKATQYQITTLEIYNMITEFEGELRKGSSLLLGTSLCPEILLDIQRRFPWHSHCRLLWKRSKSEQGREPETPGVPPRSHCDYKPHCSPWVVQRKLRLRNLKDGIKLA